jgi:transposase
MIKIEEWLMIRNLYNQGLSKSEISRQLGIHRETVSKNLEKEHRPKYIRKAKEELVLDRYKSYINDRLEKYSLSAEKLYEEIKLKGYSGSYPTVSNYVRELKNNFKKKAVLRFETLSGEQSQVDWGYCGEIYDRELERTVKVNCFVIVLGYSRTMYVEFFTNQQMNSFLTGHNNAFKYFGGYTKEILYDNLKSVVIKRMLKASDSDYNKKFLDYAGYYGFKPILCRPYKPQTKGKVENGVKYVKSNFYAGEEFSSISEINERIKIWLDKINNRIHSTTKEKPFDRLKREGLISIENKITYDLSEIFYRKVQTDCRVCFKGNFYSVPFKYAGKEISLKLLENDIEIYYRNDLVAEHILSNDKNQDIVIEEHFSGLKELQYTANPPKIELSYPDVEIRSLSFYQEVINASI